MQILLFLCEIINQTISCQNPIQVVSEINLLEIGLTALITVGAVVSGIFLTEKRNKSNLLKDSKESIKSNIDSIERLLQTYNSRETGITFEDNTSYSYCPIQFDTVSYDSLINSGDFQRFDTNSQQVIADFYSLVAEHNYIMKEIDRLLPYTTIRQLHNYRQFMNYIESLQVKLDNLEREMLLSIPELRRFL